MKSVTPRDHNSADESKNMDLSKPLSGKSKPKNNAATVTQLPVSPGQKLKQAREKLGIQLADIASNLHLSKQYIKAIEEDDFKALPGITFVRGYIRLYARQVQLPETDLIATFEEMRSVSEDVEVIDSLSLLKKRPQWRDSPISWTSYLVLTVVMALTTIWWWNADVIDSVVNGADQVSIVGSDGVLITETLSGEELDSDVVLKRTDIVAIPQAESLSKPALVVAGDSRPVKTKIKTSIVLDLHKQVEKTAISNNVNTDADNIDDKKQVDTNIANVAVVEDTLFMSFTGECWVRIGDANDKTIHVSLRGDGEVLRVKGIAPFHVKFGDATVVAVKFNERAIPVPQPSGQSNVVKFVISPESA